MRPDPESEDEAFNYAANPLRRALGYSQVLTTKVIYRWLFSSPANQGDDAPQPRFSQHILKQGQRTTVARDSLRIADNEDLPSSSKTMSERFQMIVSLTRK